MVVLYPPTDVVQEVSQPLDRRRRRDTVLHEPVDPLTPLWRVANRGGLREFVAMRMNLWIDGKDA